MPASAQVQHTLALLWSAGISYYTCRARIETRGRVGSSTLPETFGISPLMATWFRIVDIVVIRTLYKPAGVGGTLSLAVRPSRHYTQVLHSEFWPVITKCERQRVGTRSGERTPRCRALSLDSILMRPLASSSYRRPASWPIVVASRNPSSASRCSRSARRW
jgi:hypothetical protein